MKTMYSICDFVDCYTFLEWSHFRCFPKTCLMTSARMIHVRWSLIWYLTSGSLQKREKVHIVS